MEADLQSFVAFYLTGKKQATRLDDIGRLGLRPALFAGYGDLTRMRYDFPLVLIEDAAGERFAEPLSGLVDVILGKVAQGPDGDRIRKHVLRLEQAIRALAAGGTQGLFSELWDRAAAPLAKEDALIADSLRRARANLAVDGELLDCNGDLPARLFGHAWSLTQMRRAQRFNEDLNRLILKLSDIIQADYINSDAAKSAANLRDSFGAGALNNFNFDTMSSILKKVSVRDALPKRRRQRILGLISTLQAQKFFPTGISKAGAGNRPYSFAFDSCVAALKAYRDRLPKAIELARAVAMAELEVRGEYSEARHDALFDAFGENGLDPEALALFPDYLIRINASALSGAEQSTLTEILSADLPFKIVVQSDDILEKSLIEHGHMAFTLRNKQLARMTMGLGCFVMQAPSASLVRMRQQMQLGLDYGGSAVFSIYSGDSPNTTGIPPYLVAAAARESRLFPSFTFNPAAGRNWSARFSISENPQVECDWSTRELAYQDEHCQTVKLPTPFTLIDFVAMDTRYSKHFACVPKEHWSKDMVPVGEFIAGERRSQVDTVPYLLMTDASNILYRVIVAEKLVREARRCRTMWNSLQELGGIHNSHAEALLAREKAIWEASRAVSVPSAAVSPLAPAAAPAAQPASAAPVEEAEKSSDEAYIETPRCASCNECIQINDKMFAYDGNKQAYIADVSAGTFAQLVDAAENCQVAIIHPGKPRNPAEPGLDDLIKRAEAFQ
ncbi:hypothetical protein [Propionivibrio dicarboxylicus]|uniref:Ferredoxin n=1 Tax=Propionivibrio dicarboxylicus TaxID=83767 RepID=A0A1G7ZEU7_9RHOO|nr:hypothetical protein [Propionivibrio dicarboxylicus]SDH07159.1 hypothetical protein SAMN05660652_01153 [Propionivibrio dicarboxylicus]